MKINLSFKTPDVLDQLSEEDQEEIRELAERFIEFGECITIQFDTAANTVKVVPV